MNQMYTCAVYYGPNDIRIEKRRIPSADKDNFILKVENCGVCGTDVRIYRHGLRQLVGTINKPIVLGHQIVGRIHELDHEVKGFREGDRIILYGPPSCGKCYWCKIGYSQYCTGEHEHIAVGFTIDGGYAEYVKLPKVLLERGSFFHMPESVSSEEGGLIEPLSCVVHAINRAGLNDKIENLVVMGAGPVGLSFLLLLRKLASRIIFMDLSDNRLEYAKKFGADSTINPKRDNAIQRIQEETKGEKADVVIVANSSNEAQELSLNLVRKLGKIVYFGALPPDRPYIKFESNLVQQQNVILYGTYGARRDDFIQALKMVEDKVIDIKPFITHRFEVKDVVKAFEAVETGQALHATIFVK